MQLSPVRLSELHSDLKIQEKDELQWKKMKVEGLDENGEKEAQLRRNFNGETPLRCIEVMLNGEIPSKHITDLKKTFWL